MVKPRKKMGRPLEDVPLRKLVKSIRQDIAQKLSEVAPAEVAPAEAAIEPRKTKRNK